VAISERRSPLPAGCRCIRRR